MDFRVLGFTFAISIFTGVIFGLAPALRASRVDLTASLKAGGNGLASGGLSVRHDKLRGALVIAELSISLPLLVAAGLLVRSFIRLANVPPGFNPEHVVSMNVGAYGARFKAARLAASSRGGVRAGRRVRGVLNRSASPAARTGGRPAAFCLASTVPGVGRGRLRVLGPFAALAVRLVVAGVGRGVLVTVPGPGAARPTPAAAAAAWS